MNSWYLRKANGKEFGPESIETLEKWAEQSRIIAGNEISQNKQNWQLAENVAELNICHIAILPDKTVYGPFNLLATRELIEHNVLTKNTTIVNKRNGEEIIAADFLKQKKEKRKRKVPRSVSCQSHFDLLTTPENQLQKKSEQSDDKDSNKTNTQSNTEKKKQTRDKMDSTKQEFLFKDEDEFNNGLQYVVDEDAQIEMPFQEEPTDIYSEDDFLKPTQNNTIFISKDRARFPELIRKTTMQPIDDLQPVEDLRQIKLFEEKIAQDEIDEKHQKIESSNIIKPVDEKNDEITENISSKNNQKTEDSSSFLDNTTEINELKLGLETTTKVFVEQQAKNEKKINVLIAERNKLEQEVEISSDSIKEMNELNQKLRLDLEEAKQQLKESFNKSVQNSEIVKTLEEQNLKVQNALDVSQESIKELNDSKKDLTLALASERDKTQKHEKITLQYQRELEETIAKQNNITQAFAERERELLEKTSAIETSNESLIDNYKELEKKLKDIEISHIQTVKELEKKLISIRQELKAEEELKENFRSEVKELQTKIKSTDTIVNERMRSINDQTIRASTKYKQECRLTEKLTSKNKKLTIAIIILILMLLLGLLLHIFVIKTLSKQEVQSNIVDENTQKNAFVLEKKPDSSPLLLRENIDLIGATTYSEGTLLKVVFDEAMFSKLSSPSTFAIKNTRINLAKYQQYLKDYNMVVEGHTDDSPLGSNSKYKDNQELGVARAESFKRLLVVSFGLPKERISTLSAGSKNPPFDNSTPNGREKNKTIVLYFKNK